MPKACIVNNPETYQQMLAHLSAQDTIAIDTESNSLHAYHERVCLIQLSSETADFLYKTTDTYSPAHERSIRWDDPAIGIDWPLAAHGISEPLLSDKDRAGRLLPEAEC